MATAAENPPLLPRAYSWLRDFLRQELAPYPGRGAVVTRMVVSATVVMLLTMTFRIPYGAFAAIYALTISRENPDATLKAVRTILIAFAIAAADVLVGAMFFSGEPILRLVWVVATLFIVFFAQSALSNYTAAARFGYMVVVTIPLWDAPIRAGLKVEGTLWAVGSIAFASIITAAIEVIFAALRPFDDLTVSLTERLQAIEALLSSLRDGLPDHAGEQQVVRLSILGTSRMRRDILRSDYASLYAEEMGAVVAFVGRLVDIAANLTWFTTPIPPQDRTRLERLIDNLAAVRDDLLNRRIPHLLHPVDEASADESTPLLREMERTLALIEEVFRGTASIGPYASPSAPEEPPRAFFAPDAFTNPDHIRYAIKGCLAASLCYIIYNLVAWPQISTAVVTVVLTALTTIGASRQMQLLRFTGALVGGAIGMGAQIFILPATDSITGFLIVFVAVTAFASWFATSGPRLSYFGVQVALAFYLIHLQEFRLQTSLTVARDRLAGIMLGLFMMWLVFDQLWGVSAAVEMRRTFARTLRLLAQLTREPQSSDVHAAIEQTYALRESINTNFARLRQEADGVVLEFGPSRESDLALRAQLLAWQLRVRSLYVSRTALLKYRLRLPGFELPPVLESAQKEFDQRSAATLEDLAARLESHPHTPETDPASAFHDLQRSVDDFCATGQPEELVLRMRTFLALSVRADEVLSSLRTEV